MNQLELFSRGRPTRELHSPNLVLVRKHLRRALNKVRDAERMPWNEADATHWIAMFPKLAEALPADEAFAMTSEFAIEIERLRAT